MFNIAKKSLISKTFPDAVNKLAACSTFGDEKVVYNVMRMKQAVEKTWTATHKEWVTLLTKYVQKTETGGFKVENNDFVWLEGVDAATATKEIEAFGETEVTIDRYPLPSKVVVPARLTAIDLESLGNLVAEHATLEAVPS